MAGRMRNAIPAWEAISRELLAIEREQFDSEGARGSGGWAPLAQSTLDAKTGGSILRDTDALFNSLTEPTDPDHQFIAQPTWMVWGTTIPYARWHQSGTVNMPQRRFLELRASDRVILVKQLQSYLITGKLIRGRLTTA